MRIRLRLMAASVILSTMLAGSAFAQVSAAPDRGAGLTAGAAGFIPGKLPGGRSLSSSSSYAPQAFGSFGIPYTATPVEAWVPDADCDDDGGDEEAIAPAFYHSHCDSDDQSSSVQTGVSPQFGSIWFGPGRNYLSMTYPYSTVGRLEFSGGYCTAALIRRSVIVTSAWCIQTFGGGTTYRTSFKFIPAYWNPPGAQWWQVKPFGTWNIVSFLWSDTWVHGTDIGAGGLRDNDLALMVVEKKYGRFFIGDKTGQLGYGWNLYSFTSSSRTGNLDVAAVTSLGYPRVLDGGNVMQRVDGPTYPLVTSAGAHIMQQGTNFSLAGGLGSPWIVNFSVRDAVLSEGATQGTYPLMAVVGVMSAAGAHPNNTKEAYASQFRQNLRFGASAAANAPYGAGNIGTLMKVLCNRKANGTDTYADLGYCD